MATITRTTLPSSPRPHSFGMRIAVAVLGMLALGGLVASPASALLPRGVQPPGGQVPDPCANTFPSILNFTATPSTVTLGEGTTLNWRVQFPNNCSFTVNLGPGPVNPQGTATVQPLDTSIYTLTVRWGRNFGRSFGVTTQVTVDLPKDPTDPTGVRNLVTISSQQMVSMFVRALGTPNTTVIVNADLDLTGLPPVPGFDSRILIVDGVQLKGWRSAAPGQPFLPGPLLSVTDHPSPLFEIRGDNVRMTGVRIQSPTSQLSVRDCAASATLRDRTSLSNTDTLLARKKPTSSTPLSSSASSLTHGRRVLATDAGRQEGNPDDSDRGGRHGE